MSRTPPWQEKSVGGFLCYNQFMKYVFILGHNPRLSIAEVLAVLPKAKVVKTGNSFLIVENEAVNAIDLMKQLGGTIKIGQVLADTVDKKIIVEKLKAVNASNKLKYGISYYECPKDKLGMEVKGELKKADISCRLVVGKDKALSSVIVVKNHVHEFLVLGGNYLAQTLAIQDFESYGQRDFGRPARDLKSGSMPPKLAQIMINLAQVGKDQKIYDPFCGSGTLLQEALVMGYSEVAGSDKSEKAVSDTKANLEWLAKNLEVKVEDVAVVQLDVAQLAKHVSGIDAIISEPYLGPALRGHESKAEIEKNIEGLNQLYLGAFEQFAKVLNLGGKVVLVFPSFRIGHEILNLSILGKREDVPSSSTPRLGNSKSETSRFSRSTSSIKNLGFTQLDDDKLIYSRPDQKVYRNIKVFQKGLG